MELFSTVFEIDGIVCDESLIVQVLIHLAYFIFRWHLAYLPFMIANIDGIIFRWQLAQFHFRWHYHCSMRKSMELFFGGI